MATSTAAVRQSMLKQVHNTLSLGLTLLWFSLYPVRKLIAALLRLLVIVLTPFFVAFSHTPAYPWLKEFFTERRDLVVVFVAIPVSFVYDLYMRVRSWYVWLFLSAPALHDQRVRDIQAQVKRWNLDGRKKPMCTARPVWASMSTRLSTFKKDCSQISINLHDILDVDTERQIVRVEPYVNMGQLTDHLTRIGWTLAVTVEMEDLTVGGLLMGIGIENNSHIYGFLHETCEAFEVVLGDGSLVRATRTENVDLYNALPWSHGTLGFLVAAELKIIPCKPYMHVNYIPCHTVDELQSKMLELTTKPNPPQFVEATIYSKETSVIFTGNFSDKPRGEEAKKINRVNLWFKPWYYKHVEKFLETGPGDEYIPLRHWFHRHTRSIFWELEDLVPYGNTWWYRWFVGWLGAPKISLLKATWTPEVRQELLYKHVVQDITIPMSLMKESIYLFEDIFCLYPLLVYPVRIFSHEPYQGMVYNPKNPIKGTQPPQEMYFDLGAYGIPRAVKEKKPFDAPNAVRKMEAFARSCGGFQFMYADTFQTREEFEQMFDHTLYRQCRKKYNAEGAFPEVWEKVKPQHDVLLK
ncbi:uncharacterized protein VTP21DRAFT_10412 [Calcarisporiella thermophila]|uniref:uncharacterized protein n=1 Tax=Calcarisporiella thermophila TaxID=911321 RepID=UPI0037437619